MQRELDVSNSRRVYTFVTQELRVYKFVTQNSMDQEDAERT